MGEHKRNPNCELAKQGKLPPKPKNMSKVEMRKWIDKVAAEGARRLLMGLPLNDKEVE